MPDPLDLDRLKGAFDEAVLAALPGVDFFALYTCSVVTDNGDGTYDLKPQRSDWDTMKNVPFRGPFPGVQIQVAVDTSLLLGWENGQPSIPFCGLSFLGVTNLLKLIITVGGQFTVDATGKITLSSSGSDIELDASGNFKVSAGGAAEVDCVNLDLHATGTVDVGAGALLAAARTTDLVLPDSTMATWIAAVTAYVNGIAPGTLTPPTGFGVIGPGSLKVKIA